MVKTILVPTDFRIESLNTLKYALRENVISGIDVILLHACFLSDSITDLLFYSKDAVVKEHLTSHFTEALFIVRNRHKEINSLRIEVIHSNRSDMFARFLKANKVDEIYLPKNYKLQPLKKSFNPLPHLSSSNFPVTYIDWESARGNSEQDQLENLFN